MAILEITSPQYWILPESSDLARDWVDQVHKKEMLDYAISQKNNYDFKTIFYSVSYCRERGHFYALGPLLLNLGTDLLPMTARFSIDGGKSFTDVDCVPIQRSVSIGLNIRLMHVGVLEQENLVLELTLANGLRKTFNFKNTPKSKVNLVINTLQKDNEINWIVDWINYYRSFGVFSFHIYDNNSSNFDDLVGALRDDISDDTSIEITKWPFKYGIPKLGQSMFSQKASILEFALQSQNAKWAINCDIDEYIYTRNGDTTLYEYLSKFDDDIGCVQFSCFDAPLVKGVSYPSNISVRNLVWRMRQHKEKFKNGFRPSTIESASVHFVNLKHGFKAINPDAKDAFYLHALPLNTGWEKKHKGQGHRQLSESQIVKDERIARRMNVTD